MPGEQLCLGELGVKLRRVLGWSRRARVFSLAASGEREGRRSSAGGEAADPGGPWMRPAGEERAALARFTREEERGVK